MISLSFLFEKPVLTFFLGDDPVPPHTTLKPTQEHEQSNGRRDDVFLIEFFLYPSITPEKSGFTETAPRCPLSLGLL